MLSHQNAPFDFTGSTIRFRPELPFDFTGIHTRPVAAGGSAIPAVASVRAQVFEVIVRQAQAGAPWKEICLGPMAVNGITIEEVEQEVLRRWNQPCNNTDTCGCVKCRKRTMWEIQWRAELPCDGTDSCRCELCHRQKMQVIHEEIADGMRERRDWLERQKNRTV